MWRTASTSRLAGRSTIAGLVVLAACGFDPAYRDVPLVKKPICVPGEISCKGDSTLRRCSADALSFEIVDDCPSKGLVCAPGLLKCTTCLPTDRSCDGETTQQCTDDGSSWIKGETCDTSKQIACRNGFCENLCDLAKREKSNVGCEYWGVDLDNAMVSAALNAASQQYAIVVSNAQPDVVATVRVEEDDGLVGQPSNVRVVGTATIAPRGLEVFKLAPREVDGSPDGEFNTGTHTAVTRHAYRVVSNVPIVAYQFNPLENVNVFSNDASQLLPTAALTGDYVVAGWPQTIATSQNPDVNFNFDLRAFLTIASTAPGTKVHFKTSVRVVPGGPFPDGIPKGGTGDVTLDAFDVLNLETGDFNGDFTGTTISSSNPVVVYVGSEASDAPFFDTLASRYCCADHLEDQVPPVRAVGKTYVLAKSPNRSKAMIAAGASASFYDEPEYFRVVATRDGVTKVTTTLPPPNDKFELNGPGANRTLVAYQDFTLAATQPSIVAQVQASQDAAGVMRGLPGGDPSITFVAPTEQWRPDYVLLTPDKYSFDFLVIAAPADAAVYIDGIKRNASNCEVGPGDGLTDAMRGKPAPYLAYRCQMSFPAIDPKKPAPENLSPGKQDDGVHRIQSDLPVGVIAYGFDSYVSYSYCGGTELRDLMVQ